MAVPLGDPETGGGAELAVGDEVVLIDGDAHKTLLAKLLDAAENIPALAVASGWHEYWRAALQRACAAHGSYAALARSLAALGCRVQAQTVRLWCVGVTIGPDDPADLARVGETAGDPVLAAQAGEVWRAMQTLRNAHVRAGQAARRARAGDRPGRRRAAGCPPTRSSTRPAA